MEVVGFHIGAISLISLTFQSYRLVRNFASEYNSFNNKLRCVLRDITVAGSLFRNAVNALLAEVIEEDTRDDMLEDLQSEKWERYAPNGDLDCILGHLFEPVMCSIQGAQETLQEIRKLLLVLSGNNVHPSKVKLPFKPLTMGVAAIATSVLKTDPLQLHFKNIQIQLPHKKLLSLAKNHRGKLEDLRNQLKEHNRALLDLLRLAPYHKSRSRANKSTRIHPISPPLQGAGGRIDESTGAYLDPKSMQKASQRLYPLVSQSLLCECHLIHLCLGRQAKEKLTVDDPKGKAKQLPPPEKPETNFTFQMTVKPNAKGKKRASIITHHPIRLIFTGCDLKNTSSRSTPGGNGSKLKMCEELLASNEKYEKYLHDSSSPGNSGFQLQRVCTPKTTMATASKCMGSLSLDDLITSRPAELQSFDRFLIAANLAYSLMNFYASPWVRDWSLQTIHFFENREQCSSTPGLWTPHLAVKFDNHDLGQFGLKNREIYSLGLILLQLGRKMRLEPSQDEPEDLALEKAFGNLCREMGPKYTNFVRNCLSSWSDRSMDLMKDDNLSMFLSHISVLEKEAQYFNSE